MVGGLGEEYWRECWFPVSLFFLRLSCHLAKSSSSEWYMWGTWSHVTFSRRSVERVPNFCSFCCRILRSGSISGSLKIAFEKFVYEFTNFLIMPWGPMSQLLLGQEAGTCRKFPHEWHTWITWRHVRFSRRNLVWAPKIWCILSGS